MPSTAFAAARSGLKPGLPTASRLTLNFMGPGDLFGEVAVLDGETRTADATAGEPTELFVLRREDFLSHLEREPRVAIKLIKLLFASGSAGRASGWRNRYCSRCRCGWRGDCARSRSDFGSEVHISQEQLGVFVGAARESVNRQLQQWRKDGILDLQRGRILLHNIGRLTAVARNE